jgi:hypothetical protein
VRIEREGAVEIPSPSANETGAGGSTSGGRRRRAPR